MQICGCADVHGVKRLVAGARARPVLELQIHRTSAAGCSSDAAVEASTRAATTSARQPIPARPQPPFSYIAAPHFWCISQLLVPGEMLLQGSYVLVQVTHRLVWFLVLGGSAWCCVQAIGQSQAGSRAPVSPGGNGLLVVAPGVHFGIRPLVLLRCTGAGYIKGLRRLPVLLRCCG